MDRARLAPRAYAKLSELAADRRESNMDRLILKTKYSQIPQSFARTQKERSQTEPRSVGEEEHKAHFFFFFPTFFSFCDLTAYQPTCVEFHHISDWPLKKEHFSGGFLSYDPFQCGCTGLLEALVSECILPKLLCNLSFSQIPHTRCKLWDLLGTKDTI